MTEVLDVPTNWLASNWTPSDAAWILALRVQGADRHKLVSSWVQRHMIGMPITTVMVGAKKTAFDPGDRPGGGDYAYAVGDVLFVVYGHTPVDEGLVPKTVPPQIVEALNALP